MCWPQGPGRRFEVGFDVNDEVTSFYDSMIAKVIVWDESRSRAIQKFIRVVEDIVLFGLRTNLPYLQAIVSHPNFISGEMNTKFIEEHFAEGLKEKPLTEEELEFARQAYGQILETTIGSVVESTGAMTPSPWQTYWRGV
jgi:3-methylcrotonyl-CoA carboxylase alpha subunit